MSGQLHVLATLPPGKEIPTPTEWEVRYVANLAWEFWMQKEALLPLLGNEKFLSPPAHSLVIILTELPQLHVSDQELTLTS